MTKKEEKQKEECEVLERWEQSLLAASSFSQVFLHYGTLDSCIMWSRSTLLARCRICRRQRDSENMLLCDSCNYGHHLYCLKPKLKVSFHPYHKSNIFKTRVYLQAIPAGNWYCDKCLKQKEEEEKLKSPPEPVKKKRRIFRDEDIEEEEEEEQEQEKQVEEEVEEEQEEEAEAEESEEEAEQNG